MNYTLALAPLLILASCAEMAGIAALPWMSETADAPLVCNSASPCPPDYRCSFGTCTDVMQEFREVAIAVRLGDHIQHLQNVDPLLAHPIYTLFYLLIFCSTLLLVSPFELPLLRELWLIDQVLYKIIQHHLMFL